MGRQRQGRGQAGTIWDDSGEGAGTLIVDFPYISGIFNQRAPDFLGIRA